MRKISKAFNNEWNEDILSEIYDSINDIAVNEWNYDIYPNQIEIITSNGMLEAYASVGLPIMYRHWSFGKRFLMHSREYSEGLAGLAYEIVINSNPCISYLMEGNTLTMQTLVMAHAGFGHNHFFKNNYLFKQWTQPDWIINYLSFAKLFVSKCEEKFGTEAVENVLDAAHALSQYCVDKYKSPKKSQMQKEADELKRAAWKDSQYNELFAPFEDKKVEVLDDTVKIKETENILYFLEKNANLPEWKREVIRIVRKINQYFFPQKQTQVGNEGFATSTHHLILTEMENRGMVDESFMLEFLHSHSNVIRQLPYNHPGFRGLNPYALGWEMYQDIRRRCEHPTKEDEKLFPYQVGRPFLDVWFEAAEGYKDESFIEQYLSPNSVRNMRLMTIYDDSKKPELLVYNDADDSSFQRIKTALSRQYDIALHDPQISVYDVDVKTDHKLKLRHTMNHGVVLNEKMTDKVLTQIKSLWGYPVEIESYDPLKDTHTVIAVR